VTDFAALRSVANGTFRTCQPRQPMSGFRGRIQLVSATPSNLAG
jgi:hypothetical protein